MNPSKIFLPAGIRPIILFLIIAHTSCAPKKNVTAAPAASADTTALSSYPPGSVQSTMDIFLSGFERAVLSHDAGRIIAFMDRDYKTEQHDKALNNNSTQFLNEFFSGEQAGNKGFHRTDYKKITAIRRTGTSIINGYTHVFYTLETEGKVLNVSWVLMSRLDGDKLIYGLYGPVG